MLAVSTANFTAKRMHAANLYARASAVFTVWSSTEPYSSTPSFYFTIVCTASNTFTAFLEVSRTRLPAGFTFSSGPVHWSTLLLTLRSTSAPFSSCPLIRRISASDMRSCERTFQPHRFPYPNLRACPMCSKSPEAWAVATETCTLHPSCPPLPSRPLRRCHLIRLNLLVYFAPENREKVK